MHTRVLQNQGISTQVDIDYLSESPHNPRDIEIETANCRLPLISKGEMMPLHPGDCHGDGGVDGFEGVTMPFHCDVRLERSMPPNLDFLCLNSCMMRMRKNFVGIHHIPPSVALVARAYMPMVTVAVGL